MKKRLWFLFLHFAISCSGTYASDCNNIETTVYENYKTNIKSADLAIAICKKAGAKSPECQQVQSLLSKISMDTVLKSFDRQCPNYKIRYDFKPLINEYTFKMELAKQAGK